MLKSRGECNPILWLCWISEKRRKSGVNEHDKIGEWYGRARGFCASGAARSLAYRREQLQKLCAALAERESLLLKALHADLGKSPAEAFFSELGCIQNDICYAIRHLAKWSRPRRRRIPWPVRPGCAVLYPEPVGLVLIMAPWNYPLQLLLSPLVSAMAAGNAVCLKPSELTPAVSAAVAQLVADTFPDDYLCAWEGGPTTAEALLRLRFDHIFFTGSTAVGRRVMAAAAEFPTPVTLELGGKSPCIVCADADMRVAARRIAWGKFMNAGQTCVAPDYVLVERPAGELLVQELRRAIGSFYGPDPLRSPDYGRMVNAAHLERLTGYLQNQKVVFGGAADPAANALAPTLLWNPALDAPVMREEIFGPILPIIPFDDLSAALREINSRPAPLALYLFTCARDIQTRVRENTVSGGMAVNDTVVQLLSRDLPFGGVGASGMGVSHGRAGFDAFTHYRPVVSRGFRPDPAWRYPPFRLPLRLLKLVNRWLLGG